MSKKCLFCGNVMEDDDLFCDECGKKQAEASPEKDNTKQTEFISTPQEVQRNSSKKETRTNSIPKNQSQEEREAELRIKSEAEAKIRLEYEINEKNRKKEDRKNNPKHLAILSLIFAIVSYPLIITTIFLPIITAPIGLILGIKGLKSTKKITAVFGIILSAIVILFYILSIILA